MSGTITVLDSEQMKTITENLTLLEEYERIGTPSDLSELTKAKADGRLIELPSKSAEIIRIVELALRIELYDWQKAYITEVSDYVMPGRQSGKTVARMIKLCLSEGDTIDLTERGKVDYYTDEGHGNQYPGWFKSHLWDIYLNLQRVGGLKLRTIRFEKAKRMGGGE